MIIKTLCTYIYIYDTNDLYKNKQVLIIGFELIIVY